MSRLVSMWHYNKDSKSTTMSAMTSHYNFEENRALMHHVLCEERVNDVILSLGFLQQTIHTEWSTQNDTKRSTVGTEHCLLFLISKVSLVCVIIAVLPIFIYLSLLLTSSPKNISKISVSIIWYVHTYTCICNICLFIALPKRNINVTKRKIYEKPFPRVLRCFCTIFIIKGKITRKLV